MRSLKHYLSKYGFQVSQYFRYNSRRFVATSAVEKSFKTIPGPLNLPIIGSAWRFLPIIGDSKLVMHLDKVAETNYKKYGPIVRDSFAKINVVHLYDPAHFEVVAKATLNNPLRFGFFALGHYRDTNSDKYNSPGLLAVNDERWWKLRQVFQKPVSPLKEAREFLAPTDEITKEFVDSLKSGAVIEDFMFIANKCNMELVCKLLFDERIHCFNEAAMAPGSYLTNLITQAVELAEEVGEVDRSQMFWKNTKLESYRRMEKSLQALEEFAQKMIDKVKSRGKISEEKCIVAQFINDPKIPEEELLSIIIDLLLGGIHTTAITSCFLLYHVSKNPEVQAKLKEESKRLIPAGASITTSTLNEAVYSRAVIKETFRINPIATGQGRLLPDDLVIGGYRIPKDTLVILQNLVACKDDRHFKDALKFKPERWIKDSPDYEHTNPYVMMPFGLGKRACIARRRAEQNLLVFTLRMFNSGEVKWMRETELGFITPFMITPDGPVRIMFTRDQH